MRKLISLMFLASCAYGQVTLTPSGPASVRRGETVEVSITAVSPDIKAAGLQWSFTAPTAGITITSAVGAAGTAANKTLECASGTLVTCLLFGLNSSLINDGVVATHTLKVPYSSTANSIDVALTDLIAVTLNGANLPIATPSNLSISVLPARQDLNGDGRIDIIDVQISVDQVMGRSPCAADMNDDKKCNLRDLQRIVYAALEFAEGR